jgi:hypothetical protein
VRVRIDKARYDHAVAQVELAFALSTEFIPSGVEGLRMTRSGPYRRHYTVFDDYRAVVDASERIEVNAVLRGLRVAGYDRPGADDQSRQSMPFASAVSTASS